MSRELLERAIEQLKAKTNQPYELIREIKAELAKPNQAPVAWQHPISKAIVFDCNKIPGVTLDDFTIPLYTHQPAQQNPLTNDEIDNLPYHSIPSDFDKSLRRFARLIEKHHGIGDL